MTPYYHKYNFISPEPIYALVKEELNSYFLSGALDDTLFSKWTSKILNKLTRGVLPIRTAFVLIENGEAYLPEDFKYVRDAWALEQYGKKFTDPTATYVTATAKRIDTPDYKCNPCDTCANREVIQAIYKVTSQVYMEFTKSYQLRPGVVIENPSFPHSYDNSSQEIYEVDGDKIKTNFPNGTLFLTYYAEEYDDNDFQLVPDDEYIQEAIEYFIKFKLMEMAFNMATPESFNQSRYIMEKAELAYLEKKIIAETWMKKETKEQKQRAYQRQRIRLNKYKYK